MFQSTKDQTLGIIGTVTSVIAAALLMPGSTAIPAAIGVLVAAGSVVFFQNRWVESKANQWLLIIRDGKLLKSGIGLKTFAGFTDTVVRFPSKVQQVDFEANNVTKEMQGVQITGFAFWSVYRMEDGPFRCYKYMESDNANDNVKAMCQSVLRSLIANSSLNDVIRNRNQLKDTIKDELRDQFKGWGVWLQTVEITGVKISSSRLFTDLQEEFRQSTRLKASQIQLVSSQKISEVRQSTDIKLSALKQNVKTEKEIVKNTQNLKRKELQANFKEKNNELELKRMNRQKKLNLESLKNNLILEQENQQNNEELNRKRQQFKNRQETKKFQFEKMHTDLTLEKYQIDSMERVYRNMSVKNMSIHQFAGGDKESLACIMPVLGYGAAQMKAGQA